MLILCQWTCDDGGCKCSQCGETVKRSIRRNCRAVDRPTITADDLQPIAPSPQPGLGDYTEQLLSSIGVTKDRYRAAKELFGLAPTCACETRQEWLNKVGAWLGLTK